MYHVDNYCKIVITALSSFMNFAIRRPRLISETHSSQSGLPRFPLTYLFTSLYALFTRSQPQNIGLTRLISKPLHTLPQNRRGGGLPNRINFALAKSPARVLAKVPNRRDCRPLRLYFCILAPGNTRDRVPLRLWCTAGFRDRV
jgi:hypothetical protein